MTEFFPGGSLEEETVEAVAHAVQMGSEELTTPILRHLLIQFDAIIWL